MKGKKLLPAVFAIASLLLCSFADPVIANDDETKIDDDKIVSAIESELFGAKAVDANTIDVTSKQGIVTLSGEIRHMLTRDRAVRIAQMTRGVRSVVDQMKVMPNGISDEQVRTDVISALASDPATDSWEISVNSDNGKTTLEGTVQSYAERELAGMVAKSVRGMTELVNNIKVEYKSERTDAEIKNEIGQRLDWDVRLDDELIVVNVANGDVTLNGSVGSAYEKTLARNDAWVAGVKSVNDDDLEVAWWSRDKMQRKTAWESLGDDKIREAVTRAFYYDPRVYSFNPTVTVENGVVTLTGVVDNAKAKRAAAQDASNTVGVWRVKNNLKVRPAEVRTDAAIKQDIASALRRDVLINRYDINIYVNGGEVSLYGSVDSYLEKSQAEDLAARVNGVSDINNYLAVTYNYPVYGYTYHDWDPILYDYDFDYETTTTKPDHEIVEAIKSEMWWSPWVSYDQVKVSVEDGVATLTGTVDTWNERSSATENAIEGGAISVINKLAVDY